MAQPHKGNRRQIQVVTAPATLVEILKLHSKRAGLPLGPTIADLLAIELEMYDEVGAPQMLDFDAIDRSGIPATDDMTGWIQTRVTAAGSVRNRPPGACTRRPVPRSGRGRCACQGGRSARPARYPRAASAVSSHRIVEAHLTTRV